MERRMTRGKVAAGAAALFVALHALAGVAAAGGPFVAAPELDGGTIAASLALLSAGVLMLRARRSK